MDVDVVVLGGGCAGLWAARQLGGMRRVAVITETPIARYASTHNQGWLQRGAFYAGTGQADVASACRRESALIASFFPEAVVDGVEALYLFESDDDAGEFIAACAAVGISTVHRGPASTCDPVLRGSAYQVAVQADDCPVKTQLILRRLADDATSANVKLLTTDGGVDKVAIRALNPAEWEVAFDGNTISCANIVLACGALIPNFMRSVGSSLTSDFTATHIPVVEALGHSVGKMFLSVPVAEGDNFPNVVPFAMEDGRSGFTMCITNDDRPYMSGDPEYPSGYPARATYFMNKYLPGLGPVHAAIYRCFKLKRTSSGKHARQHIVVDHGETEPSLKGLYSIYPGKFTTARLVGIEIARLIACQSGEVHVQRGAKAPHEHVG